MVTITNMRWIKITNLGGSEVAWKKEEGESLKMIITSITTIIITVMALFLNKERIHFRGSEVAWMKERCLCFIIVCQRCVGTALSLS